MKTTWPTVAVMAVLLAATALDWYWVWGLFFLYWAVAGIALRQAFVVQVVLRDEHPVLFWFITITWLLLAVLTLYDAIVPLA